MCGWELISANFESSVTDKTFAGGVADETSYADGNLSIKLISITDNSSGIDADTFLRLDGCMALIATWL